MPRRAIKDQGSLRQEVSRDGTRRCQILLQSLCIKVVWIVAWAMPKINQPNHVVTDQDRESGRQCTIELYLRANQLLIEETGACCENILFQQSAADRFSTRGSMSVVRKRWSHILGPAGRQQSATLNLRQLTTRRMSWYIYIYIYTHTCIYVFNDVFLLYIMYTT